MPRSDVSSPGRTMALVVVMAAALGGCSDLYFDRRETVSLQAGDAVASNIAAQTVDPWPRAAANRHIDGDGVRTQKAIERYRFNKVTPPQGMGTSSVQYAPAAAAATAAPSGPGSQ